MPTPFVNVVTVWHALFLREALDRFFGGRAAWAWLVFEPASHIVLMSLLFSMIRVSPPGFPDLVMWLCMGLLSFFVFRRTAVQTLHAVDCNKAFFAFRQVRPFDAAFARASVEAFSMFFVILVILTPMAFFDKEIIPSDPLLLIATLAGLWLLGFGYGLITSVIQRLVPESGHIFQLIMLPLYLASGTIMPISVIPAKYRDLILINPIAHALELARGAFFKDYKMIEGVSLGYLYIWIVVFIIIGLILYKLFETRLVMR